MRARLLQRRARAAAASAAAVAALAAAGCLSTGPQNPGWTLSEAETIDEIQRLRSSPGGLERPVVVITGYASLPPMASSLATQLRRLTGAERDMFVPVDMTFVNDLRDGVDVVLDALDRRFPHPGGDTGETVEVDVVGVSMGGIVAKLAAEPEDGRPRLKINTLYTLGAPHRGADLAHRSPIDQAAQDLMYKSILLVKLHENMPRRGYTLVPYAILSDDLVGPRNSAPWGQSPIWVQGRVIGSHFALQDDDRLQIDIARRLRGEPPLLERAPLPSAGPNGPPYGAEQLDLSARDAEPAADEAR